MKGYILLSLLTALILFLVPFCAFSSAPPAASTPQSATDASKEPYDAEAPVFKVKNEKTGEITEMDEQAFVIAIVSCEMGASSPIEALKAQAVAAYTYYVKQRAAATDGVFSNVPETFFTHGTQAGMQKRWGNNYEKNYAAIRQAVEAVKGQRLLYDGKPITACYHAISAGLTESATTVWGGEYPYLVPVDSVGDLTADGYASTATFTPQELSALLKQNDDTFQATDDPASWFAAPAVTDSGFVKSISICGTTFKGTSLRTVLSLRSAAFTVQYKEGKFVFTVRGYGHNVGMSQAGAKYMANCGADYKEILLHYYPNTVLT